MIDKFNFYDVYGYFMPGAAMLLLFWLPFGLVRNSWPPSDLGTAIIGIVLAYLAGHFLQMMCTKVIPSSVAIGADGHSRYPSDVVVDIGDSKLGKEFKKNLEKRVLEKFVLDIAVEATPTKAIDQVRRDALFLARHTLIRAKEVSYAEQFQGMYTLSRGLAAGLAIACVNYIGWATSAVSALHRGWVDCIVIVVITVSLLAADNIAAYLLRKGLAQNTQTRLERFSARSLMLAALSLGYAMGRRYDVAPAQAAELALCAMGALLGCLRSYSAYKSFSDVFATTIWRDFYASTDTPQPPANQLNV